MAEDSDAGHFSFEEKQFEPSSFGYSISKVIALNKPNPQVAARRVRTLDHWKNQPALKKKMLAALQKVAAAKGLSKDVQEVVIRALG